MALDRSHLELLRALDAHRTLRAAATSINLSPSAASRRLGDAERRVGVALTHTSGRRLELTTAGRYLAEAAREADRLLDDAELTARWLDRGATRPVRIGLGFHDTLPWPDGPAPPFEIVRTTEAGWPAALADGSADLMIDAGEVARGVDRIELASDRLVAIVPVGHALATCGRPVDGPDLADLTYFASAVEPRPGFEFERLFRPSGTSPRHIVRVESAAVTLGLIEAGRGVTIQPGLAVAGRADVAVVELARRIDVTWWAHVAEARDEVVTVVDAFTAALARRRAT
ncbi:MAG: LysR family transcriptional regulator [Actinomycetota bacterium]